MIGSETMPTSNGESSTAQPQQQPTANAGKANGETLRGDDLGDFFELDPSKYASEWRKVGLSYAWMDTAHRGIMLAKLERDLQTTRAIERFAVTGDKREFAKPEDDDMGVSIGNEIHYHVGATSPESTPTPTQPAPDTSNAMGKWFWPGLLAATLGSGALGGGATYFLFNQPAATATPTGDKITDVIPGFGEPERKE